MTDIVKTISQLIEDQFPAIYREDSPTLIAFVKAYYEYMEQTGQSIELSREMFNANDIDRTLDKFISHFKAKYLDEFPFVATTDKRFLVKNILDFYSAKGSEASIKLLLRLLFQEDVDVYLPGQDILKPSDSKWSRPRYLELSYSERTVGWINKQVRGSVSNATAIVESLTTKRINGRLIDVLYLSNIKGNFQFGEFVTDDLTIAGAPRVIGSLTNIELINGGQNNNVGDILDITSSSGKQGKVRVTSIVRETGRVEFELIDGGDGYALNGIIAQQAGHANEIENSTNIFVSDKVFTYENQKFSDQEIADEISHIISALQTGNATNSNIEEQWQLLQSVGPSSQEKQNLFSFLITYQFDNSFYFYADINKDGDIDATDVALASSGAFPSIEYDTFRSAISFINFEKVVQRLETLSVLSASDVFENAVIGSKLVGVDALGNEVANSVIIELDFEDGSSNGTIVVQPYSGTFGQQAQIELASNTDMTAADIGDDIEEGSKIELTMSSVTDGPFQDKEKVTQVTYVPDTGNTVVSTYGVGYVSNVTTNGSNDVITLDPAWGTFITSADYAVIGQANTTSPATGLITSSTGVNIIEAGARGKLSGIIDPTTIVVDDISGTFEKDKSIKTGTSNIESRIQDSSGAVDTAQGAVYVFLDGVSSANGVLDSDGYSNSYAVGYVTGQNNTSVGVHSVTGTFYSSDIENTISREDIAQQILRIAVGLTTPSEPKFQNIFNLLSANDGALADVSGNGQVSAFDALQVIKGLDDGRFDEYINPKFYVETVREELISPPRNENGQIIQIQNLQISDVSTGSDATFDIGSIENEETVFLNTDLIGGNNVSEYRYIDITAEGANSSIGFIDSVDVIQNYAELDAVYVIDTTLPTNLTLDEDFTSESANGVIVDNTWELYNSSTDTVTTDNKIVVQVSNFTGDEPFAIGDTITGAASSNEAVVYKVHKLSKSLAKDIYVYQGDFANAELANTAAADVSARLSGWKEDDASTELFLRQVTAGSVSNFVDDEPIFVLQQPSAHEQRFVRIGSANVAITTSNSVSDNESSVLLGGGFSGGEPLIPGIMSASTDVSGDLEQITVIRPGLGYYDHPTVDEDFAYTIETYPGPATALDLPVLNVYTNFGYGFPKLPQGDSQTPLEDLLTSGDFTIGTISSLTSINPGNNYNIDPFVNVYNPYVAGFKRSDFALDVTLTPGTGTFVEGENITQTVSNVISLKGEIKSIQGSILEVERLNFNVAFVDGVEIVGSVSGARAIVNGIEPRNVEVWGANAIVNTDVIVANGVATSVEVIDSGFGYLAGETLTLSPTRTDNEFIATGTANTVTQGTGSGFWKTYNSHLNSNKRIRDSVYYQEFSYDVISRQSLDKYEDILKKTIHVAGTRIFGSVSIESEIDLKTDTTFEVDEFIEVLIPINTQDDTNIETEGGLFISAFEKRIRAEVENV